MRSYFYSGWAFLLPYLVTYLLYARLKWPVNPVENGQLTAVPCLLHVFWAVHVLHLTLGVIALFEWRQANNDRTASTKFRKPYPIRPHAGHKPLTLFYPLLPWACLALIFWIPGIFLEWPSDPWEHLRRINEWHTHDTVTTHSSWMKSSYFLIYSLTGCATGHVQLCWLNFYYTASCLLLGWQYYRLARALGVGERASLIFVVLNALTFGNSIFSFYRYYGLSSSIFAQLGSVALIRIALEIARAGNRSDEIPSGQFRIFSRKTLLCLAPCAGLLVVLIVFNHLQAIGLAACGIAAIGMWWWIDRAGYKSLGSMIIATATISILFIWLWPRPGAIENLRALGWLNSWYGFDFVNPSSPVWFAMFQVFGVFGILNMILGLWLLRYNHPAGWLTLMPWIALQLPFVGLPLAQLISAQSGEQNILLIHRLFFSVASGLAVVVVANRIFPARASHSLWGQFTKSHLGFALLMIGLTLGVAAPIERPVYNRFWQTFVRVPNDQTMKPVLDGLAVFSDQLTRKDRGVRVLTTSPTGFVLSNQCVTEVVEISRGYSVHNWTPTGDVTIGLRYLSATPAPKTTVGLLLEPSAFFSPISIAGHISGHWLSQESTLAAVGTRELLEEFERTGFQATHHTSISREIQLLDHRK